MYWIRRLYLLLWSKTPCANHPDREEQWSILVDEKRVYVCMPCFKIAGQDRLGLLEIREMHAEMMDCLEGRIAAVLREAPFIGKWLGNFWLRVYYWPYQRRLAKLRRNGEEPWQRMSVVDARLIRRTE